MKYCSNCGAGLFDSNFCLNCGQKQDGSPQPALPKSKTPLIITGVTGILVAFVLLACILLPKLATKSNSYESAFDNFCQAFNTQNINKLCKCLLPSSETTLKEMISMGYLTEEDILDVFLNVYFDVTNEDINIDYRIIDAVPFSSNMQSYYQSFLTEEIITEGYDVQVALIFTIDDYTSEEIFNMTVVKIDNRWCFADFIL